METTGSALPWTIGRSDATELGMSSKELRGPAYVQVRRGVRAPAGVDVDDPDVRIAAVGRQLPAHACLAGWAAARLHEAAASDDDLVVFDGSRRWDVGRGGGAHADGPTARVLVCAAEDSRLVHRDDVRIFRSVVRAQEKDVLAGIPVTSALRTAFDLARLLPRRWAVTGVDRLLHLGVVHEAALASRVEGARGWVGVPAARDLLPLLDGAVESPQESALRLAWMDAGLPKPRGNVVVRDLDGRFLGRVDLLDDVAGVVGEYDGAVHAGSDRRGSDHRRHEALEHSGLLVVRATADDVATREAQAAWGGRLCRAYAAARRPGRPLRWVADP